MVLPANQPRVDVLLEQFGLSTEFPDAVREEAQSFAEDPGFDDPGLIDRRSLPFVTIDNHDSRDLDQALYIDGNDADRFVVYYALADASHYVPRGSATFEEALRRGASYYLPGFVVPMLPKVLSEGIVSLNPLVDRRSLLFIIVLDGEGAVLSTAVERALIHSRAKLTYDGVQAFMDDPDRSPIRGTSYEDSLRALREVGLRRIQRAQDHGVVQYNRVGVTIAEADGGWVASPDLRNDVERYNEQISLLCNSEGALLLADGSAIHPHVEPVYKVHPAPEDEQLRDLAASIERIVSVHGLPRDPWVWGADGQTLADYVRGLPRHDCPRAARAIERQCMITGAPSRFSRMKGCHYGVGADAYGRFTAPMREIVGIFTHHETSERIAGAGDVDEDLRARVIRAGNQARNRQRQLTKAIYRRVLDALFEGDLALPEPPTRTGTVMGIRRDRVYVQLDDPPLEVKVYADRAPGAAGFTPGDVIHLRVEALRRDRWKLIPVQGHDPE